MGPSLNYVIYTLVLLAASYVEMRRGLRGFLQQRTGFLYKVCSLFILIGVCIGSLLFAQFNTNVILLRSANAITVGSGHLLSWIALIAVAFAFGYNDIIKGVLTAGILASLHEIWSVGTTFATGIYNPILPLALNYYSTYFVLMATLVVAYWIFIARAEGWGAIWKVFLLMGVFYCFVVVAGNPVTLTIFGPTALANDLNANLIEELGWIIPSAAMILFKASASESEDPL